MKIIIAALLMVFSIPAIAGNVFVEPSRDLVRATTKVSAGQKMYYTLTLTGGSTFYAYFTVNGGLNRKLNIWLLDEPNFQLYLANQRFNYYQGTAGEIRGVGQYKFGVPTTGRYYLVLDNSGALMMGRAVSLYGFEVYPGETREIANERMGYEKLYGAMQKLFEFRDFNIYIQHCGTSNAWSNPNITICRELSSDLAAQGLDGAVFFVLMHELGHTLLRLWDYPLSDNEDVADEFATVMTILLEQETAARQAAQWWATQTSKNDAIAKLYINDRHTLSPQRARNIDGWLANKNDLMYRWQKIFVPNLRTEALKALTTHQKPWVDRNLVQAELDRRLGTATNKAQPKEPQQAVARNKPKQETFAAVGNTNLTPKEAMTRAIDTASPIMTAIAVAFSEGARPGRLSADPSTLGLESLTTYTSEFVHQVSYDKMGSVTVSLTKNTMLGAASGKRIVLTPLVRGNSLKWSYGFASTAPRNLLPELP